MEYKEIIKELAKKRKEFKRRLEELRRLRKKKFDEKVGLDVIGDILVGRPTLGVENVKQFRYLRFISLLYELSKIIGEETANGLLYLTAKRIGRELAKTIIGKPSKQIVNKLLDLLQEEKIGIFKVKKWNGSLPERIILYEGITASGMLKIGKKVCHYEAGILSGALSELFEADIEVEEVKCWGEGYEYDEFKVITK